MRLRRLYKLYKRAFTPGALVIVSMSGRDFQWRAGPEREVGIVLTCSRGQVLVVWGTGIRHNPANGLSIIAK